MKRLTVVASLALLLALGLPRPTLAQTSGSSTNRGAAAIAQRPVGVSPGAAHAFQLAASACPAFSWTAVPEAAGYEIVVYGVDKGDAAPALEASLPAGASSWTPPADPCLAQGERYGWSVRAVTDRVSGEWSEALLFEVTAPPTDLAAALAVLQRYLGLEAIASGAQPESDASPAQTAQADADVPATPKSADRSQQGAGAPIIAVRGEVPDAAGETYGVRGVANSPDGAGVRADNNNASGPDLLLGGSPVAELTEVTFSRDSASNLTFNFTNPGAGTMTVQADGSNLVTAGGGSALWVDQGGDTMTGSLSLGGNALTSLGDVALNSASTVTKGGTRFLWDDATSKSFGVGRGALAANAGNFNTAVGTHALEANSTGSSNTASGYLALAANTTGFLNTASGYQALRFDTTGLANVATGAAALQHNTTGSYNTADGAFALISNATGSRNTASGFSALKSNTTGAANTANGNYALVLNTTGFYNTAIGSRALFANTTGSRNTASGLEALEANTTGSYNTADGALALNANTTGFFNTATGGRALFTNTTGSRNTASGQEALEANTTGSYNTAEGAFGLTSNTTGTSNTASGAFALDANTSGFRNVAVGFGALGSNTTANNNTAVGAYALDANTTGTYNVALGFDALGANTTALKNTAVGANALEANTTGANNVALGSDALAANTTGISNIALGPSAGVALTTGSNNITIGNVGVAGETGRIRIGIQGTQTETFIAGIHGNITSGGIAVFVNSSGELGTITSSRRFKEDIHRMGEASERLYDLEPVTFRYREEVVGPGERLREYGLVAEEVAEVFPELVVYDEGGKPYTVRYDQLTSMLVNELQLLRRRLERQEGKIEALQADVVAARRARYERR